MTPLLLRDRIGRIRERFVQAVREARTAAKPDRAVAFGIAGGAALLFTILSPVGTDQLAAPARLAYWLAVIAGGTGLGVAVDRWLHGRARFRGPPLAGSLVSGLVLTPPISALVVLANRIAFGLPILSAAHWLGNLPAVFGLSVGLSLVNVWAATGRELSRDDAISPREAPRETGDARADEAEALFRARLPEAFRTAEVWALEAEDHYLRVHTSAGAALILMRLSDAAAALAGRDGARTHRSWWVARAAAKPVETGPGRAILVLPDGTRAPVSRNLHRDLKARGWL